MGVDPSPLRLLGACAVASAAAAMPTLLAGVWAIVAFPVGFLIAFGHALVLGLPAYLLLRRRRLVDWVECIVGGAVIGAVPMTIIGVGVPLIFGGLYTGFGASLFTGLLAGLCGALGGAAFRAVIGAPDHPHSIDAAIFE